MTSELVPDGFKKRRLEISQSTYGVPRLLNLNKKVFLSHSGADKDLVGFLYKELCNRYKYAIAFLDDETLPKAETVSMDNILQEAKGSALGVLVLSDDFFMRTRYPMQELVEFINSGVPLLPLFYKISVAEFKDESRRAKWQEQWEEWAAGDNGVIDTWKSALQHVGDHSGLEYYKVARSSWEYVQVIVKTVTGLIPPAILFCEEGVCGMDRLCKIVESMYEKCTLARTFTSASTSSNGGEDSHSAVDVVGVYGFAGLGKTTLCKGLCDKYYVEFSGKVCHIDLGSARPSDQASSQTHSPDAFLQRMKYIHARLAGSDLDDQNLTFCQVQHLLKHLFSSMTDRVFLAIDNAMEESLREVEFYMDLKFPRGSKIFLTSRSSYILKNIASRFISFSVEIGAIPGLTRQDAMEMIEHEIPEVRSPGVLNEQGEVNGLLNLCRFHFECASGHQRAQYHPLLLKSLAASVKWRRTPNQDLKGRLAKLLSEAVVDKDDVRKTMYNLLDCSYAVLEKKAQSLFLDLVLFYTATRDVYAIQDWVKKVYSGLHEKKLREIYAKLQNLFCIRERSAPHDLLVDYAKYKAEQEIDPPCLVVVDGGTFQEDIGECVRHLSISRCVKGRSLDLRYVHGLEVLHLVDNAGLQEVHLSRTAFAHLRSVIVSVPPGSSLQFTVEDLFMLGSGPRWAQFKGNVILPTCLPTMFRFLRHLEIKGAHVLDLGCLGDLPNLEYLILSFLDVVKVIDVTASTKLKDLCIHNCDNLLAVTVPSSLPDCVILYCNALERVSLCTTLYPEAGWTSSWGFLITDCPRLSKIDGLVQYAGQFRCRGVGADIEEILKDLQKSAEIDLSVCKGKVSCLGLCGLAPGLAGVNRIRVKEAQHIGRLTTAFNKAHPKCHLLNLAISCKRNGECGCDRSVPSFGRVLPRNTTFGPSLKYGRKGLTMPIFGADWSGVYESPSLEYCCPKVRDVSSVAQWGGLTSLILNGCTSVEVWPDFAIMTSLRYLDLSNTSLKKWPAGVRLLRHLEIFELRGCRQLTVKELIEVIAFKQDNEPCVWRVLALETLIFDLEDGLRKIWLVIEALNLLFHEGWECGRFDSGHGNEQVIVYIIVLLYEFWFDEVCGAAAGCRNRSWFHTECGCKRPPSVIAKKKRRGRFGGCQDWVRCEGPASVIAKEKLRGLFCGPFFMQLFPLRLQLWIRNDEKERYLEFAMMGMAVVGAASIGWYKAAVNKSLKDSIIIFLETWNLYVQSQFSTRHEELPQEVECSWGTDIDGLDMYEMYKYFDSHWLTTYENLFGKSRLRPPKDRKCWNFWILFHARISAAEKLLKVAE